MKSIKKILVICFSLVLSLVVLSSNVYASSNDASLRYYNVDGWEYVEDFNFPEEEIWGSKYYSGSIWAWMAVYKYHDKINNELIVLLLCTSEIQANDKSYWDQKRWNNEKMSVTFSSSSDDVELVNYSPETTTGTISITNSITVGGETDGSNVKLSYSVSQSTTYTISEIPAKATKDGNKKITIDHNFIKYKTNTSKDDPACSHIKRNNLAIFKVKNYQANQKEYYFKIEYEGFIYRNGLFNSATTSEEYEQTFKLT